MRKIVGFVFVIVACATMAAPAIGRRAVATWDGGSVANSNWTSSENWVGDVAPVAGDDLVFPDGAARLSNSNTFPAGTAFASIAFSGTTGGYILGNMAIQLTGDITSANTSGLNRIDVPVELTGMTNVTTTDNGGLNISGVLSGSGGLTVGGDGILTLSANNTYTGMTVLNSGRTSAGAPTALGAPTAGTTVNAGATLGTTPLGTGSEPIVIFGAGFAGDGALQGIGAATVTGPLTLGDAAVAMRVNSPSSLNLQGVVSGPGRLGLGGTGTFILSNPGNSFAGPIVWGTAGSADSTLRLGASGVIPDALGIDVPAAGTFDLNGFDETVASLAGAGSVVLGSGAALSLTQASNTVFSGSIAGDGALNKSGAGQLTMAGTGTSTGTTTVSAGRLTVTGSLSGPVAVTGGTLDGTGMVGAVTGTAGAINPGLSPGRLDTGDVSLGAGVTFTAELDGPTAATQYDQLGVTGSVALGGATLAVALGYAPAPGATFTIVDNDGADAVSGSFAGLAEGASFMAGGLPFVISYAGGDGNDVVLTAGAAVPTMPAAGWLLLAGLALGYGAWRLGRRTARA